MDVAQDRIRAVALLALSISVGGAQLCAAQSRPPSPEQILRLSPSLQLSVQDLGDQPCATASWPTENASIRVASLSVEAVTAFPRSAWEKDIAGLEGRKVTPGELAGAADRLVCRYRSQGYVFASAQLLQAPGDGWRIVVNEGLLGRLEVAVDDPRLAAMLRRAFAGLVAGKPINARDVRRGLVIAANLGLSDVRPTVRRSRANPRALDIVLVAAPPAAAAGLDISNTNSQSLGRWGGLASVQVNGLTPLYDRTSIGVFQSLQGTGQTTVQLTSHAFAPLINADVGVDLAYSRARPGGALAPLDIDSSSWFARLSMSRYLVIRRGLVANGSVGLEASDQFTNFLGGQPYVRDRLRVAFAKVQGEALGFGGVFNGSLEARQGLSALGALTSSAPLLSIPGADPQALVLRAGLTYAHTLGPLSLSASLRGQYANRTLVSFEQMTFGALNGGMGFDPAAVAGDRGVAGAFEVVGPAFRAPWRTTIRPFAFSDSALIGSAAAASPGARWALSAGGGVRLTTANQISLDLEYAAPILSGGAAAGAFGPRIQFEVSAVTDDPFGRTIHFLTPGGPKP